MAPATGGGGAGYQWGGAGYQWGGAGYRWWCHQHHGAGAGYQWGGAGYRWGGAGYQWGGAGYQWGGAGYMGWRRLPWGGAGYRWGWRRLPMGWRRLQVAAPATNGVAPATNGVAPASDVIASVQDMLTSVAGAVVPLTQLQSDLSSFLLGIAGVQPVVDGLAGRCWAVGGRGCVGGVAIAAGPPLAGVPGVPVAGNATGIATLLGVAPPLSAR